MESQLMTMIILLTLIWLLIDAYTAKQKGEAGVVERLIRGLFKFE